MDRSTLQNILKFYTCLLVDDEEGIRVSLSLVLEKYYSHVYLASDGREGLKQFQKYKPSLIITDITMPDMNGIDMAKEILKINPDARILFITGHDMSEFEEHIEALSCFILKKPITRISLEEAFIELFKL